MSNLLKSKILLGVMIVATLVVVGAVQVSAADCTVVGSPTTLVGSHGANVICIQTKLGITADGSYGPMTKAAVVKFQSDNSLTADGKVGPMTAAALNLGTSTVVVNTTCPVGMTCTPVATAPVACPVGFTCTSNTGTTVTNGAGNLSEAKKDSSYSQVEVTSGSTDVKVNGFTIKADTGSDLTIQTLALALNMTSGGSGSTNINHYFDSVSIWEGSTKLATVNAADFDKSSTTYSKNIQLSGAKVLAGQTSEFYITVNAASSINSTDLGNNTWVASLNNLRYVDGTGAIMTDSSTGILATHTLPSFSFESLATTGGKELKVALTTGQDAINKAHIVSASTTSTTNDVPLLAFDIKAKGAIKHITEIPVGITDGGTGASNVNEIANSFTLWKDGVKIDTIDVADGVGTTYGEYSTGISVAACGGTSCGIIFNNIDFDVADASTTHMVVKVNLKKISASLNFDEGDTLRADINTAALTDIVAEDVNTDSFVYANGDLAGSATADAVTFRSAGISVALVSTGTPVVDSSANPYTGTYTMTFDVTAYGSDMYIDGTKPTLAHTDGSDIDLVKPTGATGTIDSAITSPTGATMTGTINTDARFLVAQDTTQRFTITTVVTPTGASGLYSVALAGLYYGDDGADITDATVATGTHAWNYTTNLTNFVTTSANLHL